MNIEKLTNESRFIQRTRKISAISLLESVLFCSNDPSKASLNDMALYHHIHYGIKLTRQAIANRFNPQATKFVKLFLSELLQARLTKGLVTFSSTNFNRIIIKDSTCNQLPENLKEYYPGSGGAGSKAAVRIQFEYDLKDHEIQELKVCSFNQQDIRDAKETLSDIQENDLVIRDLGYICLETLQGIEKQKAWYISRLNPSTSVVDAETMEPIDFAKLESHMIKNEIDILEKTVFISDTTYATRLVIEIVPNKIKEERLRKASYESKRKGRMLSREKKARLGLNLFVTNCSPSRLSAFELRRIYGIRWQIELIFKAWKQNSQFHKVKKMNIERYEFLLYAKLIWVVLGWKVYQVLDNIIYQKSRQRISLLKLYKTFRQLNEQVRNVVRGEKTKMEELMKHLISMSNPHLIHDDRKNRINWRIVETI